MPEQLDVQFDELPDDLFAELVDNQPPTAPKPNDILGSTKADDGPGPKVVPEEDKSEVKEEVPEEEPEIPVEEDSKEDNSNILKAKALGLIERGIWKEIKDIDQFEWTDENYGELAVAQAQWAAEDMFNEMLDQSGDYGKAIFNHIKNGGDPKEIVDLFREAKRVSNMDISTEGGQQSIIREYYSKVLEWPESKINRFINAAIDNKALAEEAEEIKVILEKEIKAEAKAKQEAQESELRRRQEMERDWANSITSAIEERQDLSEKEKRELKNNALTYNQPLPDGRKVNKFTIDFMKIQSDPKRYVELIRFVSDPEKFLEKRDKVKEKEVNKKAWEFIKGNGAVSKGGSAHTKQEKNQTDLKIDWKSAYK